MNLFIMLLISLTVPAEDKINCSKWEESKIEFNRWKADFSAISTQEISNKIKTALNEKLQTITNVAKKINEQSKYAEVEKEITESQKLTKSKSKDSKKIIAQSKKMEEVVYNLLNDKIFSSCHEALYSTSGMGGKTSEGSSKERGKR